MVFQSIRQRHAVEFADGIDVGNEFVSVRKFPDNFELKFSLRMGNANAIVLREPFEEMHTLMHHTIPGFALFVFKRRISKGAPLLE